MTLRRYLALAATPLLLVACSSSKGGSTPSTPASTPATSASASGSGIEQVTDALARLTSVHLTTDAGAVGGKSQSDVTLSGGTPTAIELHATSGGQPVVVVTRNGVSWLQTGNGWTKVAPDSPNATAKKLSNPLGVVTLTNSLASLKAVGSLLSAATATDKGHDATLNAEHYKLAVAPKKVDQSSTLGQLLSLVGGSEIPVDMWIDGQGRPVKIMMSVSFAGQQLDITVQLSNFNAPLEIPTPS